MTKQQQYYEYQNYGGTMTIEEWEQDGRFDKPAPCQTTEDKQADQARLWEELRREFDAIENERFDAAEKQFANLAKNYFIIEL